MVRSTMLLVALVAIVCMAFAMVPAAADSVSGWDAAADFSPTTNPNGAWTFGWATDGGYPQTLPYTFTTFTTVRDFWGATVWDDGVGNYMNNGTGADYTYVAKNLASGVVPFPTWNYGDGYIHQNPPGAFVMYPGRNGQRSIIRFTAPVTGTYSFRGRGIRNDYAWECADIHVVKNAGTSLFDGFVNARDVIPTYFSGTVTLAQNDTLDFVVGIGVAYNTQPRFDALDLVSVEYNVRLGQFGVSGVVRDASSNPIAGAKVEVVGGTDYVYTDGSGNYQLVSVNTGNVTVRASKAGYETSSQGVAIGTGGFASQSFTLGNGCTLSGQVTVNGTTVPAVGTVVKTLDGVYSTTVDASGNYSLKVTSGNYTVRAYKAGFLPADAAIIATAGGSITHPFGLDPGFDFQADFNPTSNPSGPWSYGDYTAAAPTVFNIFTMRDLWMINPAVWKVWIDPNHSDANWNTTFVQNYTGSPVPTDGNKGYFEPWQVLATAGMGSTGGYGQSGGNVATVKFTATGAGYFAANYLFTAQNTPGTWGGVIGYGNGSGGKAPAQAQVTAVQNGTQLFTGALNGFIGTGANNFVDSYGTAPKLAYTGASADWQVGQTAEWKVSGDPSGWVGGGLTLAPGANAVYIAGRVKSDKPGTPGVPQSLITASGGTSTYTTLTDDNGYYVMCVQPNLEYEITAEKATSPGYGTDTFVVAPTNGQRISHDFQLHFTYSWDFAKEFSTDHNPNGDWSYGYTEGSAMVAVGRPNATFMLYTQVSNQCIGSAFYGPTFWTTDGGQDWYGGIGCNFTTTPSAPFESYYNEYRWYIEPGEFVMFPGSSVPNQPWVNGRVAAIRWTAPKNMVLDIDTTWKSKLPNGQAHAGITGIPEGYQPFDQVVDVFKNGVALSEPHLNGFVGRAVNHYTDSVGPTPQVTLKTTIPINSGDTLDFSFPDFAVIHSDAYAIDIKLKEGTATTVTSIDQIKAQANGTTVFMTTPVQLNGPTVNSGSFGVQIGTHAKENYFFVQTDDKLHGLRCVIPAGGIPTLDATNKITFSGVVDTDYLGEKIIKIGSINSTTTGDAPKPFGKGAKALTNTGTLTRVWGKIVSRTPNPTPVMWEYPAGTFWKDYAWDYVTINDGGQDIKIMLHETWQLMSDFDPWVNNLTIGTYIGVTGIATTDGTSAVILPRTSDDIRLY